MPELWSITDLTKTNPALNSTAFPATDTSTFYWTSTYSMVNPSQAKGVEFNYGIPTGNPMTFSHNARCVSGP